MRSDDVLLQNDIAGVAHQQISWTASLRPKQSLSSLLLFSVPLLVPLTGLVIQSLRHRGDLVSIEDKLTTGTSNATISRLRLARSLLLGLQLITSIWSAIYWRVGAWGSIEHAYWLATLLYSLAGLRKGKHQSYVTFLCVFPLLDSLKETILPLVRLPTKFTSSERYLSFVLQVALILVPLCTPRTWTPIDPTNRDDIASPEQTCTPFSYFVSYSWIEYLIRIAVHRDIVTDDLPPIPDYDRARIWRNRILEARRDSLLWTLLVLMRWELLMMSSLAVLVSLTQFVSPLAMQQLLQYLETTEQASINPYLWAVLLLLGPLSWAVSREMYMFVSTRMTIRVKAALTQLIYMKVMIMKANDGNEETSTGKVSNLMSTDIEMITLARELFLLIVQLPLCTLVSLFLLYSLMGHAALVGFAVLLLTLPVPGFLAAYMAFYQRAASLATDMRLSAISENLNSIRITKLFGWEESKIEIINALRRDEQRKLWLRNFVAIMIGIVTDILPSISMFATFFVFTLLMNRPLLASTAFTSISYFEILRSQFLWVGYLSRNVIQSQVSIRRIEAFLDHADELQDGPKSIRNDITQLRNVTCCWSTNNDNSFRLSKLNLKFVPGLNIIVGPTACGKTSVIMALLGEMTILSGSVDLNRTDGVAYVAQSAWLQADTIRNNVLFGCPFIAERYQKVIRACALLEDFKLLERGDETEIGENGATLSGGQKQRIALARALYSDAKTLLLDDVLSALDGLTGVKVFEHGIIGSLTRGRTVILVTHAVGLCSPHAAQIITMKDGTAAIRRPESVMNLHRRFNSDAASLHLLGNGKHQVNVKHTDSQLANTVRFKGCDSDYHHNDEKSASGRISRTAIFSLLHDFGSPGFLALLLVSQLIYQTLTVGRTLFPGVWSDAYEVSPVGGVNVKFYLVIYAAIIFGESLMNGVCNAFVYHGNWAAAGHLHEKLVRCVFHTPLAWYDKSPVGRVINRFARDIQSLDSTITPWIRMSIDGILKVIFTAASVATVLPLFAVPAAVVGVLGLIIGELYTKAQISVKRLVAISESPLFSHFGDSIAGIVTIRAFGAQDRFGLEAQHRIDNHTRPMEVLYTLTRWSQIRADSLGALVSFSAALLALSGGHRDSGLVGFSLSTASGFSVTLLNLVRALNEMEIELNSFDRIKQYSSLEQEPQSSPDRTVPESWPARGNLVVKDLRISYAADGPEILKGVSFSIRAGEKVGIIGRSGSGKSTLGLTLLRFTHLEAGSIEIDGIDIENVNLVDLRQRVTIIPQDPVLFTGSVRYNLDPFNAIEDAVLEDALVQCGLSEHTAASDGTGSSAEDSSSLTLDTKVTEAGHNFSQGQRQIVALARAIVRRSKLLIMDEATASIDEATDTRIQETMRRVFRESTVLTIAHRLRTICDYDRVLVLKDGKLVEFDTPARLLAMAGGVFAGMIQDSDERDELRSIIRGNSQDMGPQ